MIFTKKDLRDARPTMYTSGEREYWIKDPVILKIGCSGQKLKSRYIRWWKCRAYTPNMKSIFEFTIPQGKWNDRLFLEALDKAMRLGGKRKLIEAIYDER